MPKLRLIDKTYLNSPKFYSQLIRSSQVKKVKDNMFPKAQRKK